MKPFAQLSDRGRTRRLRAVAFGALSRYDLEVSRLRLLATDTNVLFRVDTDGGPFALRIGLAGDAGHSPAQTRVEVDWLASLAASSPVTIAEPVPNRGGDCITVAGAPGVPESRQCVLFSWLRGSLLDDHIDSPNLHRLGALTAQLHRHAASYRPAQGYDGLARYDRPLPFDEPDALFVHDNPHLSGPRRRVFERARERVDGVIEKLQRNGPAPHLLHGDLHQWNVKVYRRHVAAFDFEDVMLGWPVQEIATTLYYLHDRDDFAGLKTAYRAGYETVARWPESEPGTIAAFMAGRVLVLANFVALVDELRDRAPGMFARWEQRLRDYLET